MKKFIKDNSSVIVKFMLTHLVMSILGVMVGLALLVLEGESEGMSLLAVVGSVFTIGFMCFMHYDDMYFVAVKEGIRNRSEGVKSDLWKGLKISLVAYSPVILCGIVVMIMCLTPAVDARSVVLLIYYVLQGSFLGLYKIIYCFGEANISYGIILYVVVTLLPALISGALGYALGLQDKTLRGLMGMKVKPPYDGPLERKPKNKK